MSWLDTIRGLAGSEGGLVSVSFERVSKDSIRVRRLAAFSSPSVLSGNVALGRREEEEGWFQVPAAELAAGHGSIAGASGSGKTRLVEAVLCQLIPKGDVNFVILDAKSELTDDLLGVCLPALVARTRDESLLDRLTVVRPFGERPAQLNVTLPEPGVSTEAQATSIAVSIEEALDEQFGGRMRVNLPQLIGCAIGLRRPLTAIIDWLADPHALLREMVRCPDPHLRDFARLQLPKESRESLQAIAARLRGLLFLPETRRALGASSCVSFPELLNRPGGITIIDVGTPPAGSERLTRLFGALIFGRLVRAILSRPVTAGAPQVVCLMEEAQEVLGRNEARSLTRLLSLARHRRCAVWTTNQSRAQLLSVDRTLDQALRVNAAFQIQFRASLEDAKAFAHLLPRSKSAGVRGRTQAVERLTRLPRRSFYFALRTKQLTTRLRSPLFDLDAMRREADRLSEVVRSRLVFGNTPLAADVSDEEPQRPWPLELLGDVPPDAADEFPALG